MSGGSFSSNCLTNIAIRLRFPPSNNHIHNYRDDLVNPHHSPASPVILCGMFCIFKSFNTKTTTPYFSYLYAKLGYILKYDYKRAWVVLLFH